MSRKIDVCQTAGWVWFKSWPDSIMWQQRSSELISIKLLRILSKTSKVCYQKSGSVASRFPSARKRCLGDILGSKRSTSLTGMTFGFTEDTSESDLCISWFDICLHVSGSSQSYESDKIMNIETSLGFSMLGDHIDSIAFETLAFAVTAHESNSRVTSSANRWFLCSSLTKHYRWGHDWIDAYTMRRFSSDISNNHARDGDASHSEDHGRSSTLSRPICVWMLFTSLNRTVEILTVMLIVESLQSGVRLRWSQTRLRILDRLYASVCEVVKQFEKVCFITPM